MKYLFLIATMLTCADVQVPKEYCCPSWCANRANRHRADLAFNSCADAYGCGGRYHNQAFQICHC